MHRIDFESLFERLPSPHMVIDQSHTYVAVNAAYERATSHSRKDLIGRNVFDVFPNEGESGQNLRQSIKRVFDTGESDTLPYLRYDIPRPEDRGGGFEERYWTAVHTPIMGKDRETLFIIQNTVDVTEMAQMRAAMSLPRLSDQPEVQLIERAREAESAQRSALAESREFKRLFQQSPQMMAVLSGPQHVFTFTNDAYRRFVGGRDFVGQQAREAIPESDGQPFLSMLDDVFHHGQELSGESVRMIIDRGEGRAQEAFVDFSYRPVRDVEGTVNGVFVQAMDRTENVNAMRHQRLLLDELNHRVKNTLATVQSIASQTLRSASDLDVARRNFEGRIIALSRAHNLLSARSWSDIDLQRVAEGQLVPFDLARIRIAGPSVTLNPQASIAIAMLLNELADNAVKHGALSHEKGEVLLDWQWTDQAEGRGLSITWLEKGGPSVADPSHKGFGRRLLERVATGELGGELTAEYRSEGFSCRIDIPASSYARMEHANQIQ